MQCRHCKHFVSKRDFHVHLRHDFSCFARWDCLLTLVTRTSVCCSLFVVGTARCGQQWVPWGHCSVPTQDTMVSHYRTAQDRGTEWLGPTPRTVHPHFSWAKSLVPYRDVVASTPAQGSRVLFRVNATKDLAGDLKAFVTIFLEIRSELCIKNIDCKWKH